MIMNKNLKNFGLIEHKYYYSRNQRIEKQAVFFKRYRNSLNGILD